MNTFLHNQFNFRKSPGEHAYDEHAVIILKPGFEAEHKTYISSYLAKQSLSIEREEELALSAEDVLVIYNDIFRYSDNDVSFGVEWKARKLDYMQSGPSLFYIVKGANAQALCEMLKYSMRDAYGKLSIPDRLLNDPEYDDLVTRNIIHVVDAIETEVALWFISQRTSQQ